MARWVALLAVAVLATAWISSPVMADEAAKVGVVSNVKVLSDKAEDVSSPEAWKKSYIKDGMSDQDKAIAIWKTVVKYRHQTDPPNENLAGERNVHDPLKTINVYGYGMCCCAASNVEGLARYLGMEARGRSITAHSVPEIKYDGDWHLFDSSLMTYFVKPDGKVASVDDIRDAIAAFYKDHPELLNGRGQPDGGKLRAFAKNEGWKKGPALLASSQWYMKDGENYGGQHGWYSNMQEYFFDMNPKTHNVYDYGPSMGYQVNIQLRDGEKITRNWGNKGLHVNGGDDLLNGRGGGMSLQKKFGDLAPGRIGNGTLEYNVLLDKVQLSALQFDNLSGNGGKLRASGDAGTMIIRMPCSYVYLTGKAELDAVVASGGSVTVSFSDNNGLDWKEVGKFDKSGKQTIDLSTNVRLRYDYRLKFDFAGKGTGLDSLAINHDFQHSQAPLPILTDGENKITFSADRQEGTITYEAFMGNDTPGGQVCYLAYHPVIEGLLKNNLRPDEKQGSKGQATFTVATPGEMSRIRMNAHYRARESGRDGYVVQVSFDDGKTFKDVEKLQDANPASSKYFTIGDVPAGTKKAQIRFVGKERNATMIFDLRMDADYKEPAGGFKPVKVTYCWEEDGQPKTSEHIAKTANDTWTIKCGPKTVCKSISMELAK